MTGIQAEEVAFSALSARSKPLVIGISIAIFVESLAVHMLIVQRFPWLALILWLTNVYTIWWLVRDYRMVIYALMLIGLMITRPQGLLGSREISLSWLTNRFRRREPRPTP